MRRYSLPLILLVTLFGACIPAAEAQTLGTVAGRVTDSHAKPLRRAVVRLTGTIYGAVTKADGSYRISHIPPGRYSVRITYVGFTPFDTSITLAANQTTELNARMTTKLMPKERLVAVKKQTEHKRAGTPGSSVPTNIQHVPRTVDSNLGKLVAGISMNEPHGFSIRGGRASGATVRTGEPDIYDQFTGGFGGIVTPVCSFSVTAVSEIAIERNSFAPENAEIGSGVANNCEIRSTLESLEAIRRMESETRPRIIRF